jgi:hypothetical protein
LFNERKWCLPKGMWETPQACGRRYSGQMRWAFCPSRKMLCLVQTQHPITREHYPHGEAWWQHQAVGLFFISRDWETGQNWRNDG